MAGFGSLLPEHPPPAKARAPQHQEAEGRERRPQASGHTAGLWSPMPLLCPFSALLSSYQDGGRGWGWWQLCSNLTLGD